LATLTRRRPVLGNQQTSFEFGQREHIADTRRAEVDAVDGVGELLREPDFHGATVRIAITIPSGVFEGLERLRRFLSEKSPLPAQRFRDCAAAMRVDVVRIGTARAFMLPSSTQPGRFPTRGEA